MEQPQITALRDTFLKKHSSQASELADNQKVFVEPGREYPVTSILKQEAGHYLIRFAYEAGEWFIYPNHWQIRGLDLDEFEAHKQDVILLHPATEPEAPTEINWFDFDEPVSKWFTVGEACQWDKRRIPTDHEIKGNIIALARELDQVREEWGGAIGVTSWYRPPSVNKAVGGVRNSQHLTGKAADIYPVGGNIYKFQSWLDKGLWHHYALGYGADRGFCHCDLRYRPYQKGLRWNY